MHITNFSSMIQLIKRHLQEDISTHKLITDLFAAYASENDTYLDHSQTSRWSKGGRPVSAAYLRYYQTPKNFSYLEDAVRHKVLPYVADESALIRNLEEYILDDLDMSDQLKQDYLMQLHGHRWIETVIANLLVYAMQQRTFLTCHNGANTSEDDIEWF